MTDNKLNLWQRLTQIYNEIEAIRKTGRNREQGYDFIEQSLIAGTIRQMLAKYGVVLKTEVGGWEVSTVTSKSGMQGTHVVLNMKFILINADNPQEREEFGSWPGEAIDFGDKAFNKAGTIGQKYFLIRQFLISDKDPDEESPEPAAKQPAQPAPGISEKALQFEADFRAAQIKPEFKAIDKEVKASDLPDKEKTYLRNLRAELYIAAPDSWATWAKRQIKEAKTSEQLAAVMGAAQNLLEPEDLEEIFKLFNAAGLALQGEVSG